MSTEQAVLGGGCFWCLEAVYQQIAGVTEVLPGYAGGIVPKPSYEQVCAGTTGHAEVVRLTFDPAIITYADILDIFWTVHNPTTLNRQGYDVGSEYRSIILYTTPAQADTAATSKATVQDLWPDLVVTEIKPLDHFWEAEEYHHNYFRRHPSQAYCTIVINPKLQQLRDKFAARLKSEFRT